MLNQQIHNYKVVSILGEGGMANVFLAENVVLGNLIALKVLKEDYVQHPNIRKRFLAEARNLAKMNHPNVIKVTDLIDAGDIVAFVMEYIDGQTLESIIENKNNLSDTEIELFLHQMIDAIEYVHSQGFIHRDIKPSNFMITKNNEVKLLDFGIAKNTNDEAHDYTKTGLMQQMGTPMYMSPEQIKNTSEVTKQTDIYSLGVVLWQLVMRKKPYDTKILTLPEIQVAILKDPLPMTNTVWDEIIQCFTSKLEQNRVFVKSSKKANEIKVDFVEKGANSITLNSMSKWIMFSASLIMVIFSIKFFISSTNKTLTKIKITTKSQKNQVKKTIDEGSKQTNNLENQKKTIESEFDNPKEKSISEIDQEKQKSKLKIGQKHQGGIVFFIDKTGCHGKIYLGNNLGELNWTDAVSKCTSLNIDGFSDWHLPSKDELNILFNKKELSSFFVGESYWSSTPNFLSVNQSWGQDFTNGSQEIWHISYPANAVAIRNF
jgi:serine/threonine protein kinase